MPRSQNVALRRPSAHKIKSTRARDITYICTASRAYHRRDNDVTFEFWWQPRAVTTTLIVTVNNGASWYKQILLAINWTLAKNRVSGDCHRTFCWWVHGASISTDWRLRISNCRKDLPRRSNSRKATEQNERVQKRLTQKKRHVTAWKKSKVNSTQCGSSDIPGCGHAQGNVQSVAKQGHRTYINVRPVKKPYKD